MNAVTNNTVFLYVKMSQFFKQMDDYMKENKLKVLYLGACFSVLVASNCYANSGSSIQAMGSWWEAGDSGSTYGFGLRGTLGVSDELGIDLGWTYFGAGDDVDIDLPGTSNNLTLGGIDAHSFDLGVRYTLPMELYLGGGLSYFALDHDTAEIDGEWGVYGLVGWSFGGEHIRAFIEGMYRYTEGTLEYDNGFEGSFSRDVDYDGFAANVGIMYRF
jgi:hypothetical protein